MITGARRRRPTRAARRSCSATPRAGRSTAADEGSNVTVLGSDIARKFDKHVGDTIDAQGRAVRRSSASWSRRSRRPTRRPRSRSPPPSSCSSRRCRRWSQRALDAVRPRDLDGRLPDAGRRPRGARRPDRGAGARRRDDDRQGLRPADRRRRPRSSTRSSSGSPSSASLVGGLSVINTMAMSIAERTREIGIKRAIGGSRSRIVRELVTESALIGFLGGAIGLALGAARRRRRQRGRPLVRHRPVRADAGHGPHRGRVLDDPRRPRRLRPRPPRGAARSGRRASLRMSRPMTRENERCHSSKAATCARPTASAGATASRRCAASTSRSSRARWSRSWARPARARAR